MSYLTIHSKRDGNCLYSSISAHLLHSRDLLERLLKYNFTSSEKIVYECFVDAIEDELKLTNNGIKEVPNEMIGLLRLAIADYLREHKEEYKEFIEIPVDEYIKTNIDVFGSRAGEFEFKLISEILECKIKILDEKYNLISEYGNYDFEIAILHTPDHFDALIKKNF